MQRCSTKTWWIDQYDLPPSSWDFPMLVFVPSTFLFYRRATFYWGRLNTWTSLFKPGSIPLANHLHSCKPNIFEGHTQADTFTSLHQKAVGISFSTDISGASPAHCCFCFNAALPVERWFVYSSLSATYYIFTEVLFTNYFKIKSVPKRRAFVIIIIFRTWFWRFIVVQECKGCLGGVKEVMNWWDIIFHCAFICSDPIASVPVVEWRALTQTKRIWMPLIETHFGYYSVMID